MKNEIVNFKDFQNILNVCKRLLKDKGEKKVSVVIFGEEMDDFLLALSSDKHQNHLDYITSAINFKLK